jgi:hypothetical protein
MGTKYKPIMSSSVTVKVRGVSKNNYVDAIKIDVIELEKSEQIF